MISISATRTGVRYFKKSGEDHDQVYFSILSMY
jgi:hypothetical protein